MPRQKVVFALIGYALIASINAAEKSDSPTECVQLGNTCHQHRHCCSNLKCGHIAPLGRFECQEKAKLDDTCKYTSDCYDILHSVCKKKKCACRQDTIRVSDYACAPLLGAYCWKNETCASENSQCIYNECQCSDDFIAESNKCLPTVIGYPCGDDAACRKVKSGECSSKNVCACAKGTVTTNKRLCLAALGETCQTDRECGVSDSWCDDNKCQCRDPYFFYSNNECKLAYLGMPCKNSRDCNIYINNSICIYNKCSCRDNYSLWDGNACVLTAISYCEDNRECSGIDGICVAGRCKCRTNYVMRESKCLPEQMTERCETNSDCSKVKFAECVRGKCTCVNGFLTFNATTCARALGKSCIVNQDCYARFSNCFDGICKCSRGYRKYSETQCAADELGVTCSDDITCDLLKYTDCFESQCSCKNGYVELDALTCAPLLNASCSGDWECETKNSACIEYRCQCKVGYYQRSKYECVLMYLEQSCKINSDCIAISHAKCSDAEKCICQHNYVQNGPKTCSPTLGRYCEVPGECVTLNSECSRNRCRCSAGYMERCDDYCSPVFLGQACDVDENCSTTLNAECSNKECKCRPGYTKFGKRACLPLLGKNCIKHKDCAVYNSNCVDNTCQCLETFVAQTQSRCLTTSLDGRCSTDDDCKIPDTHCSKFQFCVCNQHHISSDRVSCRALLGAYCADNATCITANSECINNECKCRPDYVSGPYNDCLPKLLGGSCTTDYDCNRIKNAICIDNICACKPNTFALTASACTHLLNTDCSSSDDCEVEESDCFENKCHCIPGWAAIADTMCVRRSALYYCDDGIECGEPWRSTCLQNHCLCNSNHIAVNALSCLPSLGGSCWRNDQCMTKNSDCIDFRCQCKPGFVSVASNMCVAH